MRGAGADPEERGEERQAHREHRAERDEQDDHGREQPDGFARALLHLGDEHVATELDAPARDLHVGGERLDLVRRPPATPPRSDRRGSPRRTRCARPRRSGARPSGEYGLTTLARDTARSTRRQERLDLGTHRGIVDPAARRRTRSGPAGHRGRRTPTAPAGRSPPGSPSRAGRSRCGTRRRTPLASANTTNSKTNQPTRTRRRRRYVTRARAWSMGVVS